MKWYGFHLTETFYNQESKRGLVSLSNPSFSNPRKWKRHGTIFIFSAFFQNMMFPVWFVLIWSYLCVKMWTNSFPPGRSHLDIWAGKRIIDRHILKYSACCKHKAGWHLFVELSIILHVLKHLDGNHSVKGILKLLRIDLTKLVSRC